MKHSFTSKEAVAIFSHHTGFKFHPTVPGQLLARRGVRKLGDARPSEFPVEAWAELFRDMLALALKRCAYDSSLTAPREGKIPAIDYIDQAKNEALAGEIGPGLEKGRLRAASKIALAIKAIFYLVLNAVRRYDFVSPARLRHSN